MLGLCGIFKGLCCSVLRLLLVHSTEILLQCMKAIYLEGMRLLHTTRRKFSITNYKLNQNKQYIDRGAQLKMIIISLMLVSM